MRPDQLPLLTTVSAPSVHPDGTWAVVATSRPDFDADTYTGQLFRVPLDGSPSRRLTRGRHDTSPRFSPDGALIGFLREGANECPQLHLLSAEGGEPLCVTNAPLGVSDFTFAPDGSRVAFIARVRDEGRYGELDGVDAGHEDPRRLTTLFNQANGLGWVRDRRSQLFVVDVPDVFGEPALKPVGRAAKGLDPKAVDERLFPTATQLTRGDAEHGAPAFSAGGASVLLTATHADGPENLVNDLVRVPLDGSAAVRVFEGHEGLDVGSPTVTGDTVWALGTDLGEAGLDFVGTHTGVYRLTPDGPELCTDPDVLVAADLTPAGDAVLMISEHRGASQLVRVSAEGTEFLLERDAGVVVFGVGTVGARPDAPVVVSYSTPTSPGEVGLVENGAITPLTDFSATLRESATVREAQELTASAPDGYPVHGWVVLPDGEGPHPVLLMIHGGPFAAYTTAFFDEAQVYAEAGYAVVMCNPRGSAGYGRDHGRAIKGSMGELDQADVLAFLDHAVASMPALDGSRVGIMGGSYGGYLTAWIIAHDSRWAGAIVERGYLDPASFIGSSDIGWFFPAQYNGDLDAMNAQSPMLLTDRVRTPTFVVHSEEDLRCPLSQALRYYTQLKQSGVETELLVFPGENHELSRSGTPWHRRQRFEAILDWWARHLPVTRVVDGS